MIKMMFMVFRKPGLTHEQCVAEWTGDEHLAFRHVLKPEGLCRYVQDPATGDMRDGAPDGIGELWFEDRTAMDRVMKHPARVRAFDDAKRFADLDRSYPLIVGESVIIE